MRGHRPEYTLQAPAVEKVVDVRRAPGTGDRVVDIRNRQAERARLLPVDRSVVLRFIVESIRSNACEQRAFCGQAEQLCARLHESRMAKAALVNELEIEAGCVAQLEGSRWGEADDHRALFAGEVPVETLDDLLHPIARTWALLPRFQADEAQAGRLPAAAIAVALDREDSLYRLALLLEQILRDLIQRQCNMRSGSPGRRCHLHEHESLVLIRQVASRQPHVSDAEHRDDQR